MIDPSELQAKLRAQALGGVSLDVAYIGVANDLFCVLHGLGTADAPTLARAAGVDAGYVLRWCDAAYAFGYLNADGDAFRLTPMGEAMRADAPGSLFPLAFQAALSAHMAERAAGLMRSGERPGEPVLAERETLLPLFGPTLESHFGPMFERTICPAVPVFAEVDARGGLAVDLGCGNGWYLRALGRRCPRLRGLGVDGFEENVRQARERAAKDGLGDRLEFVHGDIHDFNLDEPADLIAMNRALHHVWEKDTAALFRWFHANLKPGGSAVIWEPAWPDDRSALRQPAAQMMAFQNVVEHVQGNHFLRPAEIRRAFADAGMDSTLHLFAQGTEAVVVARRGG